MHFHQTLMHFPGRKYGVIYELISEAREITSTNTLMDAMPNAIPTQNRTFEHVFVDKKHKRKRRERERPRSELKNVTFLKEST